VPLVTGAFSTGNDTAEVAIASPSAPTPESVPSPANTTVAARPSWPELDQRMHADPLMQSAKLSNSRNPFGELALPNASTEMAAVVEEKPSLSAAGLVLSSTAVGARRRTALINGRIYGEGDLLDLPGVSVTIVRIRPRSVLLESKDEQLELTIAERPATEKIQVRREQSVARSLLHPED